MKTLFLAAETPLPPTSGTRLRVLHLARQLGRVADVDLAALGPVEPAQAEPFSLRGVPHDRGRPQALARAIRRPYMVAKLSSAELASVARRADSDTFHVEPPFLFPSVDGLDVPVVLGAQNVEAEVMASFAEAETRPLHRLRWRWEAWKTERFERHAVRAAAAVTVPSDHDAEVFEREGAKRVVVVPNGVDTSAVEHRGPAPGGTLLYVGHYGYRPNVVAAKELATEVLPRVPDAELRLVGRDPGPDVQRLAGPRVTVTGQVEDAVAEFHRARALVVPLRSGGGTRLKILEALAAGTPVVSTPFGVAGLDVVHGEHVLVGKSPADLAELAARVIRDDDLAAGLSDQGRRLVEECYDWSIVARPFVDLHRELAGR